MFSVPKFSGYAILQYQYSGQKGDESNTFNLRIARVSVDGTILNDFAYKVQAQINGNTSTLGNSPRLVDLFLEWKRFDFAKIKLGQFKRPFTLENPMNPIDQGFMNYSQVVSSLSGFNDRTGEHPSNGRDIGIQLEGDFLKTPSGRNLIHYQVGVFNGQGINTKDVDNKKDVIGGIWVVPVSGLRLGIFGWTGSYARKGEDGVISLSKRRYAISGEYVINDWTFRSEYIHSTGLGFEDTYEEKDDASKTDINLSNGSKADGYYLLAIAPIIKNKLHVKARYDMYRKDARWDKAKTLYELGADYIFIRHLQISAEYAFVNDRSLLKHNYSMADIQVSFRF
ncbi:MAG: OprO/OprP family phosphate-selective porin [Prevotella sp.]|nr:OprO/OprP family phosphate-selective porin [Prevotella sp.]